MAWAVIIIVVAGTGIVVGFTLAGRSRNSQRCPLHPTSRPVAMLVPVRVTVVQSATPTIDFDHQIWRSPVGFPGVATQARVQGTMTVVTVQQATFVADGGVGTLTFGALGWLNTPRHRRNWRRETPSGEPNQSRRIPTLHGLSVSATHV